jgi:pyruvate/2-oxoglutarate dehydrogenase complex dihydrolipoamide acyltransferase (E2) component
MTETLVIDASEADEDTIEAVALELWEVASDALDENVTPEEIMLACISLQKTMGMFLEKRQVH